MKPLFIEEITLTNFKNYSEAKFNLGDKFNLVYGLNGTGKTNLLDGIYYLCVGKSYFTPFDQKVVKYDETLFRLAGFVTRGDSHHEIIVKVKPGISKEILIDASSLDRISDHLGFIPVVISAPKDIDLVLGLSQTRRRYFDHLLCQKDHDYFKALVTYNHLLHMRSASLKQDFRDLKRMIETLDEQMGPLATTIFEKRKWLCNEILPLLQSNYRILSDDREEVNIEYDSSLNQSTYEMLTDMNWEKDKSTQRTNAGIHKDDYNFFIKSMPAKEFASQGQNKSFIFALHLSKSRILSLQCGFKPLLIFDDIFDKLDDQRLARLMEVLMQAEFGQILLSDTSRKRVGEYVPASRLHEIEMNT